MSPSRGSIGPCGLGIPFNEHIEGDGPTVFAHACKMGLEGIVSKRKDSTYRSGHSLDWVKMKNSSAYSAQCRQERLRSPSSTPSATVRRWRAACLASSSGGTVPFEQPLASRPV